ncbi:MAG: glycosyltransferase family 2 protein [Armatimonadetes bacterium]|nr:glycosyltransferase family 2 protein [Armatimonadota bacterium]MDE2205764.1 glycosyltransferase family 2 protein [Armatimonadota bacterium]
MDVSIVILSWNTRDLLASCLRSIAADPQAPPHELIVVDNASEDGSREMVREQFPNVRLLVNPVNLGFGAGNNTAIPVALGRYVLFLNSDTLVHAGALAGLIAYADARPVVGIVGPKLLNDDGSLQYSCRRYPTLGAGFFRNTPLGRLFPNNRFASDYLMQNWPHQEAMDVDWVSGAALMIRREVLDETKGFDEEFYFYCEDLELCWRVNHSGRWKVSYYPHSVVTHSIGRSSDKAPTRMTWEFHRSQYLFYRKHYRATTLFFARPLIPLGIVLRATGQMTRYRVNYWRRRLRKRRKPGGDQQ